MPFASGVFSLVSGNPVVTGTTISSTWANNTLNDIADNGLSYAMLKDGTQTPTANLTMGGFRLTNLGAATAVSDAPRVSQVQNQAFNVLTSVAGTNTITATVTPTPSAYAVGQVFRGVAAGTNTGAATLNVSSLGAGAILAPIDYGTSATALIGGEIIAGNPFEVMCTTTTPQFMLMGFKRQFSTISFRSSNGTNVPTGTTTYITVGGDNATIGNAAFPVPFKCVVDALYTRAGAASASGAYTYTLMIDGSASPLSATASNSGSSSNTTSRATVPAGSDIALRLVVSSTATATIHMASIRIQPVP